MTPVVYLGVMNTNEVEEETAQGAGSQKVATPSIEVVEKWLASDLRACISMLNAIYTDKDLLHQVAVWFNGRVNNAANRPDPAQMPLFNKTKAEA